MQYLKVSLLTESLFAYHTVDRVAVPHVHLNLEFRSFSSHMFSSCSTSTLPYHVLSTSTLRSLYHEPRESTVDTHVRIGAMATDAKPVVRRSRAGCAECRRRRRRCDESKPSCRNCLMIGHECKYLVELSWGGRPFARSIFGQCMGADDGVSKIATSTQCVSIPN